MADIVQIEIEIPKMGCVNVDPDIPEKEEISVDAREKSFITHDELFHRDLPDQHPISAIAGLQQALNSKQAVISDLQQIRSGAAKGSTAVQPDELQDVQLDLEDQLDSEARVRTRMDNQLSDRINNEANARLNKDNELSGKITAEENRAKDAESELEDMIIAEGNLRSDVDDQLNDRIAAEERRAQREESRIEEKVDSISSIGRYLSNWNCTTGLPASNPETSPYEYKSGDYYLVGTVGATNYRPTGSSYTTGVASTVVETAPVSKDDVYVYDGTNWLLLYGTQKTVSFQNIAGNPYDNSNLSTALNEKQNAIDDLSAIRSGASAGASALQPNDDITELNNNAGYISNAGIFYWGE